MTAAPLWKEINFFEIEMILSKNDLDPIDKPKELKVR